MCYGSSILWQQHDMQSRLLATMPALDRMSVCCLVGQFKDLIEMAERDRVLCDTLKKVLKLTKGWDAAREHAMAAVGTDNQMRIWYQDDAMLGGLLFKCQLGCIDLDSPVGTP